MFQFNLNLLEKILESSQKAGIVVLSQRAAPCPQATQHTPSGVHVKVQGTESIIEVWVRPAVE